MTEFSQDWWVLFFLSMKVMVYILGMTIIGIQGWELTKKANQSNMMGNILYGGSGMLMIMVAISAAVVGHYAALLPLIEFMGKL